MGCGVCERGNDASGCLGGQSAGVRLAVAGGMRAGWLRFDSLSGIIVKSIATGVFSTEGRPGRRKSQDKEGSHEGSRTLRTENQNRC